MDKDTIAKNFSKAAKNYEQYAILQKIVAQNLAKQVHAEIRPNSQILDLGCGTGFLADFILKFSSASSSNITRLDISEEMLRQNKTGRKILADIEDFSLKGDKKFDFIVSSLAFQWLNNPIKTILRYQKLLSQNGVFACSFLGFKTFYELEDVLQESNIKLNLNNFTAIDDLFQNLEANKFFIDSKMVVLQYNDVFDLLNSIKKIGARNSDYKNRLLKSDFQKINEVYFQKYAVNQKIPCSWEIITISNKNETID